MENIFHSSFRVLLYNKCTFHKCIPHDDKVGLLHVLPSLLVTTYRSKESNNICNYVQVVTRKKEMRNEKKQQW